MLYEPRTTTGSGVWFTLLYFLKCKNESYRIFKYGSYKEEDYINYLQTCKYGIWIGTHESQGFGLQEVLSCDVPLLVWSVTNMNQQENWRGAPDVKATTIGYWSKRWQNNSN